MSIALDYHKRKGNNLNEYTQAITVSEFQIILQFRKLYVPVIRPITH